MRRNSIMFAAVLLLLGLVTSIAIAWLFAACEVRGAGWRNLAHRWHNDWHVMVGDLPGRRVTLALSEAKFPSGLLDLPEEDSQLRIPRWIAALQQGPKGDHTLLAERAFGWPLMCMRYTYELTRSPIKSDHYHGGWLVQPLGRVSANAEVRSKQHVQIGRMVDSIGNSDPALPLIPVWPGLLGSALFWGFAWLCVSIVLFAPARVRRHMRSRRNHCVRCSYPLSQIESSHCPECGWDRHDRVAFITRARLIMLIVPLVLMLLLLPVGSAYLAAQFPHPHPLQVAAARDDVEALEKLLQNRAEAEAADPGLADTLRWAIQSRSERVLRVLIERGADIHATSNVGTLLHHAALWGNAAIFQQLVDAGLDPKQTATGRTPLHVGVYHEDGHAAFKQLLGFGMDVNAADQTGNTALHNAAEYMGGHEIVKLLIEHGAAIDPVNAYLRTPLMLALTRGSEASALALLEAGADATDVDDTQSSVLHALFERTDNVSMGLIKALLERGACTDCADASGRTPLMLAIENHHEAGILALLDAGAAHRLPDGASVLHRLNWDEASDLLLDYLLDDLGLDINARYARGLTPLMIAAETQSLLSIERMLERGADPALRDDDGHGASWHAPHTTSGDSRIRRLLERLETGTTSQEGD